LSLTVALLQRVLHLQPQVRFERNQVEVLAGRRMVIAGDDELVNICSPLASPPGPV
jgi:hypothetical protein